VKFVGVPGSPQYSFPTLLRSLCHARGISLNGLARRVGVSEPAVRNWLRSPHQRPTAERLRQIADILQTDPDLLFASAGQIPEDIRQVLCARPEIIAAVRRAA
jgi:transcriptional regulator with XRE-family HTH domain